MKSAAPSPLPAAVVLSCLGAAESDLNVVRSLGPRGIPVTVITEYAGAPSTASRHCREVLQVPRFTRDPQRLADALERYARSQPRRPVVFPSADPDLILLLQLRERLQASCDLVLPPPGLIPSLFDKRRFAALAEAHRLEVPRTRVPDSVADLRAIGTGIRFPAIVKPSDTNQWNVGRIAGLPPKTKAVRVDSAAQLEAVCAPIIEAGIDIVIQEMIPGDDPEHCDLHAFIDREGRPVACFTGRKHRILPIHAGSGCFVESVVIEPLIESGLRMLRELQYTGIANINYKRDPRDGRFRLLEINPRVSQWNILAARCGVNIPWLAYAEQAGLPLEAPGRQREGVFYVNWVNDRASFRGYRAEGSLGVVDYARTLLRRPMVYQLLDFSDPWPFVRTVAFKVGRRLSRWARPARPAP